MITRTMTKGVDHKGSIASDADCIASLVNERRVALHAPTSPSSLAINTNSVEDLEGCNASLKVTPPKRTKFHKNNDSLSLEDESPALDQLVGECHVRA